MANPYVNKVILSDGTVLIDLSGDSISAADAIVGVSLHLATGKVVTGTLDDFTGATASANGAHGLVPQPDAGEQNKVLFGDGDWGTIGLSSTFVGNETMWLDLNHGSTRLSRIEFSSPDSTGPGLMTYSESNKLGAIEPRATRSSKAVLWTNSDPTASFAAQTISLGRTVSELDFFLFEFYYRKSAHYLQTLLVTPDTTADIALRVMTMGSKTGGRNVSIVLGTDDCSFVFGAASFDGTTNNEYCIPYRIIGIKL